jgi:hypothetical protein
LEDLESGDKSPHSKVPLLGFPPTLAGAAAADKIR